MPEESGWFTRERLSTLTLLAATAIALWVSYRLVEPLLPALAWAVAFAIVADPVYQRLAVRFRPAIAASLTVAVVAITIVGPVTFVTQRIVMQASQIPSLLGTQARPMAWLDFLRANVYLRPLIGFIEAQVSLEELLGRLSAAIAAGAPAFLIQSVWEVLQLIIALFVLFYFFRDRGLIVDRVRSLLPLSAREADEILYRVSQTIYAAVYGQVAVSLVQGTLGGIIFAVLGLPAPVLWGAAMFVVAIFPLFGPFVIWAPVAVYLAAIGDWHKAAILTVFGTLVIGLIDNLLYPILVGERLRLHTVPVFFAIVGGLFVFGASGIVLGPVVLAVTLALLDVWRRRTAGGRPAETGAERPRAA